MKSEIGIEVEGTLLDKNGKGTEAHNHFNNNSPNKKSTYRSGVGWGLDGHSATAEFRSTPQPLDKIDEIIKEFADSLKQLKEKDLDMVAHPYAKGHNGLHITIDRFIGSVETIKMLDILIAMPLALIEHTSRQRRVDSYGKLGSFTTKNADEVRSDNNTKELIEWRTLSAFWATTPETLKLVLQGVSEIIMFIQSKGVKANELYCKITKNYQQYYTAYRSKNNKSLREKVEEIEKLLPKRDLPTIRAIFQLHRKRGIKTALSRISLMLGWTGKTPIKIKKPKKVIRTPVLYTFIADNHLKKSTPIVKKLLAILEKLGCKPLLTSTKKQTVFETGSSFQNWCNEYAIESSGKTNTRILAIRGSNSPYYKTSFSISPASFSALGDYAMLMNFISMTRQIEGNSYPQYNSRSLLAGIIGIPMAVRENPTVKDLEFVKLLCQAGIGELEKISKSQTDSGTSYSYLRQLATKKELKKVKEVMECVE